MDKVFVPRRLDVRDFAEEGAVLRGQEPLRQLTRLATETQHSEHADPVTWSAVGELRNRSHVHPEVWLHLRAQAILALTCQRCLQVVDVPVSVERSFRFVGDEQIAAEQDEGSEEDVLVLSRSFDLFELVEDELLMELPLAPRHQSCPVAVKLASVDEDFEASRSERESPFAILDKFKPGR
jgi:uncharacterized protein